MLVDSIPPANTLEQARRYVSVELSLFPGKVNGTKEPALVGWRVYAEQRPTDIELRTWFDCTEPAAICIPGGKASGNLIVLDFEKLAAFMQWGSSLDDEEKLALSNSPIIRTPNGGRHVYVRTTEPIKGCKLARTSKGATLIETRGDNHYVVAAGSPVAVHSAGLPYTIASAGWLDGRKCEPMSIEMFNRLTVRAVQLNQYVAPSRREVVGEDRLQGGEVGDRPGDHFNDRATWAGILGPHGWQVYRSSADGTYWSRPGKKPAGVSASTGHCKGPSGRDLFYVFSTSAVPFEAEVSYSRFAAYAILNHRGDFSTATKALAYAGYGISRDEWRRRRPTIRIGGKVGTA